MSQQRTLKERKQQDLLHAFGFIFQNKEENKMNIWSLYSHLSSRWSRFLTGSNGGKEKKPKEAEDRRSHHLVDGPRMDFLVQFGRQVGVVHVVPVCQVFEEHVHQPCTEMKDKEISRTNPLSLADKPNDQNSWM